MHRRYGWLLRLLLPWFFGPITYAAQNAERVRRYRQDGILVYVTRGHSTWLTLCYNYILERMALPLATFVGGVNFFWLQSPRRLWRTFKQRHMPVKGVWQQENEPHPLSRREALLVDHALRGGTAFVALPMPRGERTGLFDLNDYIRALIVAQKYNEKPIFLAPHILVDREQSGATRQTVIDRLFGDRRRPGGLRHVVMLLTLRRGTIRMADAINLQVFMREHANNSTTTLARKVRHELHWRMSEEERVVAGPHLTVYETTARHVMRDSSVRAAIVDENARTGKTDLMLEALAQSNLRGIAARYNVRYIKYMSVALNLVFNRIYDGIAVDEAGLHRVLEASRRGPLIFCPSHRSHIDYLVLSFVLWQHRITPPHIAAGANLSFFPLGTLFRRCGAFFLRRTFRDDPLYAAVFGSYVFELIKSGTSIEFFLEGTRSRTGKFLTPKFGFLKMLVDAWRRGARDDLQFVPISIDYERIIEAHSYERELKGADKKAEDIGGLLSSTKVLRSRYGRVQLQFGEPISLADLARQRDLPQSADASHDDVYRREIERLGFQILYNVAAVGSVTATAVVSTVILGHQGRGVAQNKLLERSDAMVEFLQGAAARLTEPLRHAETRVSAILEAVQKLVDEKTVVVDRAGSSDMEPIYRAPDETRVILDYHKNAVMNYFAPAALVSRAIVKRGVASTLQYDDIHADTRFLSRLLKKEFIYRVDRDFTTYFDETLGALAVRGVLDVLEDSTIRLRNVGSVTSLAGVLDSFLQSYWVTAKTMYDLRTVALWDKDVITRTLERTRRAFLEGDITRPEAANRSVIETALRWLIEAGVASVEVRGKRKMLQLSPDFGPDKLQQLIDEIHAYL